MSSLYVKFSVIHTGSPNSSQNSLNASEYETVCDSKAKTLPANARVRVPPPKPSSNQLTRLSKEEEDYDYTPVFTVGERPTPPKPVRANLSEPESPPATDKSSTMPPSRPVAAPRSPRLPRSPRTPNSTSLSSNSSITSPDTADSELNSPFGKINLKRVGEKDVDDEKNNNSTDGKVYEEWLVKPSQLKAQKNGQLWKAK